MFVLVDANARIRRRVYGCSSDDGRVVGAYGRDVENHYGERLLSFATHCKLAPTNTFFSPPKDVMSHAHNGDRPIGRKRIYYVLTRQTHRSRLHDVTIHPQPPSRDKPDSDHNIVYVAVDV